MAGYVMTARRKAALRKAQLASARKRRGKSKPSKYKKAAARAAGQGLVVAGFYAYSVRAKKKAYGRHPPTATTTMSRNAPAARPAVPGMKAIGMGGRTGRQSQVNFGRVNDPRSPYYQSRMQRGQRILARSSKQAPPVVPVTLIPRLRVIGGTRRGGFITDSNGVTTVRR
jgi:hypothetical protein